MSAEYATTARPSKVTIAWATRDSLFAEIPCKNGPPLVVRYPLTTAGLQAALNVILDKPDHSGPRASAAPSHPAVRRPLTTFTDDQRTAARDVLKKMGIT